MRTTPATAVTVREAAPEELPALGALIRVAYREYAGLLPPARFEEYLDDLSTPGPGAVTLVIGSFGRLFATARFYPDAALAGVGAPADWSMVRALGVLPAARGTGLARALMAECAARAANAGAPVLALHTADFMISAVRLYEGLGYRPAPQLDFVVGDPDAPAGSSIVIRGYTLDLD